MMGLSKPPVGRGGYDMSLFANVTAGGTNGRPRPMVLGRDVAARGMS